MEFNLWLVIIGLVFILMGLAGSYLQRLPLTTSILYLVIGFILGPVGLGLLKFDPFENAGLLERLTEIAVLVSLFGAGLKLRTPLNDGRWKLPVRLAFGSMFLTIALITLVGVFALHLPIGAAILLGAMLAPTDPVLASDVQVENAADRDRLRFSLTGEAGLNDGSATPFVMLGMGLLGLHEIGDFGWRWLAVDVIWAVAGGLAIGWLMGTFVGKLVMHLRREHKQALGLDDFLVLGLIGLAYGLSTMVSAYGFLAVFAAGLAVRRVERNISGDELDAEQLEQSLVGKQEEVATDPEKAPVYMAQVMLGYSEHLERIGEIGIVLLLGGMLAYATFPFEALWFIPLLFLVIRPISVWLSLKGSRSSRLQRGLMCWFGIRGIGSLYYLMYAIEHGLAPDLAQRFTGLIFSVVTVSIIIHGISVTPLMNFYASRTERRGNKNKNKNKNEGGVAEA